MDLPRVLVVAVGGAIGSLARWGLSTAYPAGSNGFPWATFAVNISGSLLIGVVMVLITMLWSDRRLVRPFVGVGVLGGYTTFSTYAVDAQRLIVNGAGATALVYLAATVVLALAAATTGIVATRAVLRGVRR